MVPKTSVRTSAFTLKKVSSSKPNKTLSSGEQAVVVRFRLDIRENILTERLVRDWNWLLSELVELTSLTVFKKACRCGTWWISLNGESGVAELTVC